MSSKNKMFSLEKIDALRKEVSSSSKFIRSSKIKESIKSLFENEWLPNLRQIKELSTKSQYNLIENLFNELYEFSRKDYFLKSKLLEKVRIIHTELDKLRIAHIKNGVEFREDIKSKILSSLEKKGLTKAVKDFKIAEDNIKKDPSISCSKTREGCEEIFRVIRENKLKTNVSRGTLSQHSSELEARGIISSVEKQFFSSGLYGFLSEKGNHSNKEPKTEADALFGFKLALVVTEYLFNKNLI